MLRKTKSVNIVAAISVIAILISSSIFTIPVFAQNEQQQQQQPGGIGSPQGNQTATAKNNATLVFHDEMRRMWLEHDIYIRLMLVSYTSGNIQDFNATVAKALKAQEDLVNFTAPYLGQANTQNLSTALKMHITLYAQVLAAARANDTAALNANLTLWYDNAKEISTLLETALSPVSAGNQTVPGGNQTVPGGNQTIPGGNQTVPGGNQTVPGGNQTVPGANQSKPAVIWIVAGSAGNMSSVGFSPAKATVKIGVNNTVTWINNDTAEHTVSGISGPMGAPMPGSGYILPNQNYTLTFTVPGTYRYHCSIHTWMQGTITVEGNQTISGGNRTVPGGNQTIPGGNQSVPGGNQSVPGGNQSIPGGNQTIPGGNQTVPGANQTIPGGNRTAGRGANVSILQDMNTHLNLTLRMTVEYLNGNYTASLMTFQEIIKGTLKMADIISNAIITMNPSKFTMIGTVSRP